MLFQLTEKGVAKSSIIVSLTVIHGIGCNKKADGIGVGFELIDG